VIGSPTLIHFWAKSCHVCHDNMPTIGQWRDQYADKGLKVVAIHMPREPEDTNVEAVRTDAAALGITEPCAIDNLHTIGDRFENSLWPAYFLFDAEGSMRGRAGGYAGLKMIEGPLKRILNITE
jgi:thiol-disulfide isomerase/thioredoxin